MKLPRQAADVAMLGEEARDEHLVRRDVLPVLAAARGARVAAGQERGARGGRDRALGEGVLEERPLPREAVHVGRPDEAVTVASKRVEALLVGADPEEVGLAHDRFNPCGPRGG
jgi:hypothetical protein